MVRRFFSLFNFGVFSKEINGVHNAAYLIGLLALMSQLLALVRDKLLAYHYGAGVTLDIYYSAFRIPDLIFATVASLVSISVLIPFLSKSFEKDGGKNNEETKSLIDGVFTAYFLLMIIVSAVAFLLMPIFARLIMPNLPAGPFQNELILLSRLLLLQPIALGISNLLGSITQVTKRFFLYALSPLVYNISIILGIVFLAPIFGIKGIIYGVILGSIFHFSIQIPYIAKLKLIPVFTFKAKLKPILEVVKLSLPRTLTLSLSSLELIFITFYASNMTQGSITIYNLSLNLQSVPFAIIGVSYSLAAFPTLSRLFTAGHKEEFLNHVEVAVRHIIFWSIPITALFIVLRAQIVRTILGSGSFNWDDTRLTAACLSLFTVSLVAQGLELLLIRAYYAAGNTKKPLVVNVISSILTIGLPFIFIMIWKSVPTFGFFMEALFKVDGIPGSIVLSLPLGFSIGTIFNMIALWILFRKDFKSGGRAALDPAIKTFFNALGCAVIAGFIAYLALNALPRFLDTSRVFGIFLQGFIAGIIGIISAIGILFLLKSQELKEVMSIIPRKVFRQKGVVLDEASKID